MHRTFTPTGFGLLFSILILFLIISCQNDLENSLANVERNYQVYCGGCHLIPDPGSLTKDIWENSILPRMGIRLGIPHAKVDGFAKLSDAEKKELREYNLNTFEKVISDEEWKALKEYVIKLAPDSIRFEESRLKRSKETDQFIRRDFPIDQQFGANVCAIEFDENKKELWLADFNKTFHRWSKSEKLVSRSSSPVVDFSYSEEYVGWCEIGVLFPTNLPKGKVVFSNGKDGNIVIDSLRRPVQADRIDLNGDLKFELLIAEFGNDIGGLSMHRMIDGQYKKYMLSDFPGAIKFVVQDMDNDGRKDIVALFAQGDESIFIFYQQDDLTFVTERVLRFPPGYGTSDFELVDYNQDGKLDITTAHGDNADYSYSLKNFHGVRIYLNEGDTFKEKYFYPIYGSTKVIPYDFDEDGDIDIATSSFFPAFDKLMSESFIYLENKTTNEFKFEAQIIPSEMALRSLCLERADFDADGDQDLILGQFSISPQPIPDDLKQLWLSSKNDITVLFNQLR